MALVLMLSNVPYIVAFGAEGNGKIFSGFIYEVDEPHSYLAKMRQGREGAWLYTNRYTPEPHRPALIFVYYLFLGHVSKWLGLSMLATYHLARVAASIVLLFAVKRLLRVIGFQGGLGVVAFALVFLAEGIGWAFTFDRNPPEKWLTDAYLFQSMTNYSHFSLGIGLVVLSLADLFQFARNDRARGSLVRVAIYSFLLAWIHPRLLLTIVAVGGGAALMGAWWWGWRLRPWLMGVGVALAASAPPAIATWLSVRGDPVWAEWAATPTRTPNPFWFLVGYGLLWPLGIWGALRAWRGREPWAPLLVAWLVVGSVLPYLPLISQRRLVLGWSIPLAMLSAYALLVLASAREPRRVIAAAVAIAVLPISTIVYVVDGLRVMARPGFPIFYHPEIPAAAEWLKEKTEPEAIVLSHLLTGMFIPALSGNRVFAGHWAETLDDETKQRLTFEFFNPATNDGRRAEILAGYDVRYVLVTPVERQMLGGYNPSSSPRLFEQVWRGGAGALYEFKGARANDEP